MTDMITQITDHDAQAKKRLITQYQDSENIKKILTVYTAQIQEIEDELFKLINDREIDTAAGYQLDQLGTILNEPRFGLNDDNYRLLLKAKIAENTSEGTIEDVISIFRMLLRPDEIVYNEIHPAGFELTAVGSTMPIASIDRLRTAIERAKVAGVDLVDIKTVNQPEFSFFDDPDPTGKGFRDINILKEPINAFELSSVTLPDGSGETGSNGLGDVNNPLIGGSLSYIVETDTSDDLDVNAGHLATILV